MIMAGKKIFEKLAGNIELLKFLPSKTNGMLDTRTRTSTYSTFHTDSTGKKSMKASIVSLLKVEVCVVVQIR